jgi:hypothetical protein
MRFLIAVLASSAVCGSAATGQTRTFSAEVRVIHPDSAPTSSSPTLAVTEVNIPANSLAWDPVSRKIYLSLPSAAGANGNAIQVLDPATGVLGANVFAGSEPNLVAISATSKYLYVGVNGASSVQRFTLPNLATDISIALGNNSFDGPYFALDLQASPASDGTVAVVRGVTNVSPTEEGGVLIYDDTAARPNVLCGFIQSGCPSNGELYDSIQWNADASAMFAANNEDTGFDFYTMPVTASGFGTVTDHSGLAGGFYNSIHFDRLTKYVYDDSGEIIDPVAGTKAGTFGASGVMVPDGSLGTAFFLSQGSGSGTYVVTAFDMQRLTPIATATISNVVGTPKHLIRWGSDGLAFTTASSGGTTGSAIYVLSGSFVGSLPPTKIGTCNAGQWYLDLNGNGTWDGDPPDLIANFGWAGATYVTGDWNGNGHNKIGVYQNGFWYLDYDGNGVWDGGVNDKQYVFGWADPNVIPVVGDWNGDGRTKIGVYYNGFWYLDYDGNGVWDGGVNDKQYNFGWAATGVTPMLGDWNSDGRTKVGIYYNGLWYLDYDGNGIWDGGVNDKQYNFGWAATGVTPMLGDWNGDGRTKVGIYYNGLWYLDYDGNGVWDGGVNDKQYVFGWSGMTPLVGDWSANGKTKIGIFYNGNWALDYNGNGTLDGSVWYAWGKAGDTPMVGKW